MTESSELRRTPLYDRHREAGARLVGFAGWEMPVQYRGLMEEHRAVRSKAGLFDVSHMGEVRVSGPGAESYLQWLTPNDVSKLAPGRAHYSALLTESGTYLDDLLVYRLDTSEFLVVVNAANAARDFDWMLSHCDQGTRVENVSNDYALLALQGPRALEILAPLAPPGLGELRYYGFLQGEVAGAQALVSRTGYTGEDGFEIYVAPEIASGIWQRLLEAGASAGLQPAGLGARDTLRLEAAMALYGHEIDDTTTPWEADLGWTVKLSKGDFIGKAALIEQKQLGVARRLVGFEVKDRGIARQGHTVLEGEAGGSVEGDVDGDVEVGVVTSGTYSPTFEKALGLAYVPLASAAPGTTLALGVRGKRLAAEVVEVPFYRRPKPG